MLLGTKFENVGHVADDMRKALSFKQGASFTMRYITTNTSEFAGKTIKLENYQKAGTTWRELDLRVGNRLYEMKSWSTIPPAKFADEFFKDLDILVLGNINNGETLFKNLDWIFDFKKLDPKTSFDASDITKFVDELKDYTFTNQVYLGRLLSKYGVANQDQLANLIGQNFNEIIKISN